MRQIGNGLSAAIVLSLPQRCRLQQPGLQLHHAVLKVRKSIVAHAESRLAKFAAQKPVHLAAQPPGLTPIMPQAVEQKTEQKRQQSQRSY